LEQPPLTPATVQKFLYPSSQFATNQLQELDLFTTIWRPKFLHPPRRPMKSEPSSSISPPLDNLKQQHQTCCSTYWMSDNNFMLEYLMLSVNNFHWCAQIHFTVMQGFIKKLAAVLRLLLFSVHYTIYR
jgi:hypothetical protein